MDKEKDARARELSNLRLALATFALQLDAFEMRMTEAKLLFNGKRRGGTSRLNRSHLSDAPAGSAQKDRAVASGAYEIHKQPTLK
jgi:hypothetical protein